VNGVVKQNELGTDPRGARGVHDKRGKHAVFNIVRVNDTYAWDGWMVCQLNIVRVNDTGVVHGMAGWCVSSSTSCTPRSS
jgi:hypothetical protein